MSGFRNSRNITKNSVILQKIKYLKTNYALILDQLNNKKTHPEKVQKTVKIKKFFVLTESSQNLQPAVDRQPPPGRPRGSRKKHTLN